jgi:hypothetical protein
MAHETKAGTADAVPDSFGPRHHGIVRRGNVRVNGRQQGRVNADNDLMSLPRRGQTSFFLCYRLRGERRGAPMPGELEHGAVVRMIKVRR